MAPHGGRELDESCLPRGREAAFARRGSEATRYAGRGSVSDPLKVQRKGFASFLGFLLLCVWLFFVGFFPRFLGGGSLGFSSGSKKL